MSPGEFRKMLVAMGRCGGPIALDRGRSLVADACRTETGDAPPQACSAIPLTAYSRDVQNRMADELPAAGADVQKAMADYGALRAVVRACQGVK